MFVFFSGCGGWGAGWVINQNITPRKRTHNNPPTPPARAPKHTKHTKKTTNNNNDNNGNRELSGFTDRAGARLATPRLLRLRPEDVVLTGGRPLRGAKFTWVTEAGRTERWVVASCGRYSVVWNFKR